jgi:hypothetical protein
MKSDVSLHTASTEDATLYRLELEPHAAEFAFKLPTAIQKRDLVSFAKPHLSLPRAKQPEERRSRKLRKGPNNRGFFHSIKPSRRSHSGTVENHDQTHNSQFPGVDFSGVYNISDTLLLS